MHLNLTHTPPSILKEDEPGNEGAQLENVMDTINDPGFIGNLTLVPTAFRTGSYGWKGSRRIAVELQDGDTDGEGRKETVEIMLTCVDTIYLSCTILERLMLIRSSSVNATVVGSKHATSSEGKEKEQELEVVAEDALHDEDE